MTHVGDVFFWDQPFQLQLVLVEMVNEVSK